MPTETPEPSHARPRRTHSEHLFTPSIILHTRPRSVHEEHGITSKPISSIVAKKVVALNRFRRTALPDSGRHGQKGPRAIAHCGERMERRRKNPHDGQRGRPSAFLLLGTRTTEEGDCVTARPQQAQRRDLGRAHGPGGLGGQNPRITLRAQAHRGEPGDPSDPPNTP